jgi:aspartyl/asparaginyl-tRNA synthetase
MRRRTPAQAGPDGGLSRVGQTVTVRGWVRTVREQKTFAFIEVRGCSATRARHDPLCV